MGTRKGIRRHDGRNWVTHGERLTVTAMVEERTGNIWFGTAWPMPGIIKYTPKR